MSDPVKILFQLDTDPQPSTFDGVVAVDAGVEQLFRHGGIDRKNVIPLVHGAMFTRGGKAMAGTALFIGGSDVAAGEAVMQAVQETFFGPVRVSVMLDSNGCNTTAAAAVLSAERHLPSRESTILVMGGTGAVGLRVCRLLANRGAHVRLGSRSHERAAAAVGELRNLLPDASIEAHVTADTASMQESLQGCQAAIACGSAGVRLLDADSLNEADQLRLLIDLNAVPPMGIEGIEATDKAREENGRILYGALGVGGLKMRIHRTAVQRLFHGNDQVLDIEQIYALGAELEAGG
jgi:hypothetical protein